MTPESSFTEPVEGPEDPGTARPPWFTRSTALRALLVLMVVGFVADFWYFNLFGVYEDDYLFTVVPANWSASDVWQNALYAVQFWPQGRPIWWVINPTLAWLCAKTGTLATHYALLYAVMVFTAFLIFRFLRRFVPAGAALCGALFFLLNPADASGAIIMHMTNYFIVLAMTLLSLEVYLGRFRYLSLPLAAAVLLTYEPYFLFFALFPLVGYLVDRRVSLLRTGAYWLSLAAVFLGVMFARKHLGDDRSAAVLSNLHDVILKALKAPWIGAWTNLKMDVLRPWDAVTTGGVYYWLIALMAAGVMLLSFDPTTPKAANEAPATKGPADLARLFAVGWVFVLFPYVYRFHEDYYPPVVTLGRLSAMHIPSGFGFAIVIATVLALASRGPLWLRRAVSLGTVAYLALLVSVGVRLQRVEQVRDWDMQKSFWQKVFSLTADAGDGDCIIVNSDLLPDAVVDPRPATLGFPPFWMVSYSNVVYASLFDFPDTWKDPPAVFSVYVGMKTALEKDGGMQLMTPPWRTPPEWPVIHDGDFIWLEWHGADLVRVETPVSIGGRTYQPKKVGPAQTGIGHLPAYNLLFPAHSVRWKSILEGINYPP